jgi:hypothetical protein
MSKKKLISSFFFIHHRVAVVVPCLLFNAICWNVHKENKVTGIQIRFIATKEEREFYYLFNKIKLLNVTCDCNISDE